jgi:hypothetical protein
MGGQPPSLEALTSNGHSVGVGTEPGNENWPVEQVVLFSMHLFHNYQIGDGAMEIKVMLLLTASILLRLSQFLKCLQEHPAQKYGTTNESMFEKHRFLQLMLYAAGKANFTNPIDTLNKWAALIDADFYRRNFMEVPMNDLVRTFP